MLGPERRLTLVVVTPGAASAGVVAMIGMSASTITWRIRGHSCNARHREAPDTGKSLRSEALAAPDASNDHPAQRPAAGTRDHCTVPRARPPGMLQEQPVPTGAELVKAQVRTGVTQYPPAADATGVWYVAYG